MALSDIGDPRLFRQEPAAGAAAQLLLLLLLGTATGLGPAGWLAGLGFAAVGWAVLVRALARSWPHGPFGPAGAVTPSGPAGAVTPFGPANAVTLARATLVGGVTALVADSLAGDPPPLTVLAALGTVALVLDAVDGKVARRTGTASPLGARFDMEVDAFLILVLSVQVALSLGPWVLLIGAMRYAFVAAARPLPWLNGPLPPSTARKTVAALQGIVLLVAATVPLPGGIVHGMVLAALGSLAWSFARDVRWLWRVRGVARVREGAAGADRKRSGTAYAIPRAPSRTRLPGPVRRLP